MSEMRRRHRNQPNFSLDDLLNPDKMRALKSGTDMVIASRKDKSFQVEARLRVRPVFEDANFHPRIAAASKRLYRDAHYRNAVLDACVALINLVKKKSRREDLDGSALMSTVFSRNNPILAVNDLKDKADHNEQEGLMHLFMGVVLALRNPRAHALPDDSPEMALEYIALISLLAKRVDRAKRRTP